MIEIGRGYNDSISLRFLGLEEGNFPRGLGGSSVRLLTGVTAGQHVFWGYVEGGGSADPSIRRGKARGSWIGRHGVLERLREKKQRMDRIQDRSTVTCARPG